MVNKENLSLVSGGTEERCNRRVLEIQFHTLL